MNFPSARRSRRQRAVLALQAAVAAGLLWLVFRNFDWEAFVTSWRRLPWWFFPFAAAVVAGGQLLYALRWRIVAGALGVRLPFPRAAELFLIGVYFNNFLPTSIGGDAARLHYLGRSAGYARAGASILADRGVGLMGLALIAGATGWNLAPDAAGRTVSIGFVATLVVAGGGLPIALALLAPERILERIVARFRGRLARLARPALEVRARLRRHGWLLIPVLLVSAVYWASLSLTYMLYFDAMGADVPPFPSLLAAVTAIALLANVPVSPNGVGLREYLHVVFLTGLGVSRELAVGASILVFGALLAVSLAGGALWLRLRRHG